MQGISTVFSPSEYRETGNQRCVAGTPLAPEAPDERPAKNVWQMEEPVAECESRITA